MERGAGKLFNGKRVFAHSDDGTIIGRSRDRRPVQRSLGIRGTE